MKKRPIHLFVATPMARLLVSAALLWAGIPRQSALAADQSNYDRAGIIYGTDACTVKIKCYGVSQGRRVASNGAGVIISSEGYTLTAYHVVQGFSEIFCTTAEGPEAYYPESGRYSATLVMADAQWDIALLKIKADRPLPYSPMASVERVVEGRSVVVVGNPLGMGQQLTKGTVGSVRTVSWDGHEEALRTVAAPIQKGHSGGGTFDLTTGELLGINVAKSASHNHGYFVPIDRIKAILNRRLEIVELADAEEIFNLLGVRLRGVKLIGGKFERGVLLTEVAPGSVAEAAGWEEGDVLVGLGEYRTVDQNAVLYVLRHGMGEQANLRYVMARGDEVEVNHVSAPARIPGVAVSASTPVASLAGFAR